MLGMRLMESLYKTQISILFLLMSVYVSAQKTYEFYEPAKNDSIRVGKGDQEFMPYIESGFTLLLPEKDEIKGVLLFLEGSNFDQKNKSGKSLYPMASKNGFAVLSISTGIPLDFYFDENSITQAHELIQHAFKIHKLPNKNIFFLGGSLVGHRAMRYIQFTQESKQEFQLKIQGLVLSNFTLDWTRKWYQHQREIKIKRNDLWEPTFMNFILESHLKGTPKTDPEAYHKVSAYSYFDAEKRNIKWYKNFAIRGYIEPAIKYRLTKKVQSLYENSATDIVGFLAELQLAGNNNVDLVVIQPGDNPSQPKTASKTWEAIDKKELMHWILEQSKD